MPNSNIYDSARSMGTAIEELRGLIKYKDLIAQLIRKDIVTRYKRSTLGILWTMLNPLGTMIILSVVFSRVFDIKGVYPAFVITNLVAWTFFSQITQFSLNATLWGSGLYNQIYMPRTSFVISTNGAGLVNLLFSLVPLTLIFLVTRVPLSNSLYLFPFAIILMVIFTLGMSLIISTAGVFFPDIGELYPVILQGWFYISPIIFPEKILSDFVGGWLLKANPFYHVLKVFQMTLFDGLFPSVTQWLNAGITSVVTIIVGWLIFTRFARLFHYRG